MDDNITMNSMQEAFSNTASEANGAIIGIVSDIRSHTVEMQNQQLAYAIKVGEALIELKQLCKQNGAKFGDLFSLTPEDRQSEDKLPFNQHTGNKLMAIARNEVLRKCSHANIFLPTDWSSLYELSRVEPPKLQEMIEENTVHGDMSRDEVARVVVPFTNKAPRRSPPTKQRLSEITSEVNEQQSKQTPTGWKSNAKLNSGSDKKAVEPRNTKPVPPSAILHAREAIKQLEFIDSQDDHFDEALELVAKWIEEHQGGGR